MASRHLKLSLQLCARHSSHPTSLWMTISLGPTGPHLCGESPGSRRPNIDTTGVPTATAIWTGPESFEMSNLHFFKRAATSPSECSSDNIIGLRSIPVPTSFTVLTSDDIVG